MSEKVNIIVADDEVHILRVLEVKFNSAGFEVVRAHDGVQAWEEVRRHQPALVITDYQMPGLNGVELAERMYADGDLRFIPVVLLTARGFHLNKDDLAKTNIVRVVSKPFSPRELMTLVNETLSSTTPAGR